MKKEDITLLQAILAHLHKDPISLQHLAVSIRDKQLFDTLEDSPPGSKFIMTPIELAQHLGYSEFFHDARGREVADENVVLFDEALRKYTNILHQYRTRRVKVLLNYVISYSDKVSVIDLNNCTVRKSGCKVIIKSMNKKYYFKGPDALIDRFYTLIIDRAKRIRRSIVPVSNDTMNYNLYSFLSRMIAEEIKVPDSGKFQKVLKEIEDAVSGQYPTLNYTDPIIPFYKVYRTSIYMPLNYTFEPLSFLQRLCEPFVNIGCLDLNGTELDLFRSVVIYSIASFALYKNRIKRYFDPFTHETFTILQSHFKVFVEQSVPDVVNLVYLSKDVVFILSDKKCEFRVKDFIIKYEYNQRRLDIMPNDITNVLNTKVEVVCYKAKIPLSDITAQGGFEESLMGESHHLTSDEELEDYAPILSCTLDYNKTSVSGAIKDSTTTLEVLKGLWGDNVTFMEAESSAVVRKWDFDMKMYHSCYNFTLFAMQLNFMQDAPKSDSRNREDIRLLEDGNVNECREVHEILMNREKVRVAHGKMTNGRMFHLENGIWFLKDCFMEDDNLEFKV